LTLSSLPFDLLGQVGPILAWAEGDFGSRLPIAWSARERPFRDRERGWLLGELPTYSYDNVDDIVSGARREHRRQSRRPAKLPKQRQSGVPSLSPPPNFDLIDCFRFLNEYFFLWNGTEPCIRDGRMEDLHELALRLPLGHIVRHSHAQAVSEGVMSFEEALRLPELVTLLPSNSFGMRSVVRQGLSESHLHLKAVVSAEETWADNLLKPITSSAIRGRNQEERRLLLLNLFAGRLLALAVWMSLAKSRASRKGESPGDATAVQPRQLLTLMDSIYFARSEEEEREAARTLLRKIQICVTGNRRPGENDDSEFNTEGSAGFPSEPWEGTPRPVPVVNLQIDPQFRFLLRWISPTSHRLDEGWKTGHLPGNVPEDLRRRQDFVHRLHLAAHLQLVRLSARQEQHKAQGESSREKDLRQGEKKLEEDPRRHFLHEALYRYMVCRTHHWQMVTQRGQTTGLSFFREFYGAPQRKLRHLSALQEADLVFERLRGWRGLRVLEGRVGPPDSAQDLVPWILAYARPRGRRLDKFGLVVHFKKEHEHLEDKGLGGKLEPPVPRLRWGLRRRRVRGEAMRLYRLLRRPTPVVPFIVGIDACNLELATPPEVFAPVFRFLRELPISTTRQGHRRNRFSPFYDLEPKIQRLSDGRRLGMTYHVGEDFRHLLSGLRAIHEVVKFLAPQPGDRLGHGTALALEPEIWLEHNGYQAVLSKMEWLDTLVWVHHFLGPGDRVVGQLGFEDTIQRLSWEIYSSALSSLYDPLGLERRRRHTGPVDTFEQPHRGLLDWDWSPLALWDAWTLRQLDPYAVDLTALLQGEFKMRSSQGFCEEDRRWDSVQERILRKCKKTIGSRNAHLLLALYWLSPKVKANGEQTIVVDMQEQGPLWLALCSRAEEKMKGIIQEREMIVEVNPSSNRIIGPMARYEQHHLFQLTLDENQRLARGVRVSVNTDNPAVCNTTLAHEYYLVGEILMKRGVPEAEVVRWLEWLRKNGEDYCFARQLPTVENNPDMRDLVDWLRRIRPGVLEARTRPEKRRAFWTWHRDTALRRLGFSSRQIDSQPELLERWVALSARIEDLQGRESSASGIVGDLEEQIQKARSDLETLEQSCR